MNRRKLLLFAGCLFAFSLRAQTPDDYVTQGRAYLAAHDLVSANAQFNAALSLSPNHEAANALAAATRLLLLPQLPPGSNFLNRLGFTNSGRDIYNWTSEMAHDTNGSTVFPATFNTSEGIAFYRTNVMVALAASRTNLVRITNSGFTLSLTAGETSIESVTLDYGDILLLRALLHAAEFVGYTANAHNFNVVIQHLHDLGETNGLTIQRVLSDYSSLLTLSSPADLAASKSAFTNAILRYLEASAFIRNSRPPGAERLFNLSPEDEADEATFRDNLAKVLESLDHPVKFSPDDDHSVYTSNYFAGTKTLRSLVPRFDGDRYINNSLPDYTLGGFLVDEPPCDTEAFLREFLGRTYAGIYIGEDYSGDIYFSVFVRTNQQATVVGFESYNQTGIFFEFKVEDDGSWHFETNGVSGWGRMYSDGWFEGEVHSSGGSAWLWGEHQPDLGPLQSAAGYYAGTWTGGGESGPLRAILSADGRIYYCPFDSTGEVGGGGSGELDSTNHFTSETVDGSTVAGTLNPATRQITGNFISSDTSGTWTLNRTAFVPFDVPPTITSLPQNKTAVLGTNVTFSLVVTGSPPLCYQWSFNDAPISKATSATLVVSNVQWAGAGTYAVLVRNVVGATNAAATLTVVPETIKPTLTVTAPTANQRWSNAVFTVKGTAGDNVRVSNVWHQLNGGSWADASSTNGWTNWTATVDLLPGTNVVRACAVDTCGNVSPTNSVSFVYVVTNRLLVRATGQGTLSPNYSNAVLEIGRNYSMTASGVNGHVFTNWVVSTNWVGGVTTNHATVQFMMQSNLTLQVSFADVTKPTLGITAPTANQRWSNAVFTVKGTAGDNVRVTNVWQQLNGGSWADASSTNGWTNWTATVGLQAGTNVVRAYAVDASGNRSTTNAMSFFYVVTNRLLVRATGQGTLSPNYSNAVLEVGRNYSMTASAVNGHVFTNWVVSTNWVGEVTTNHATVQFMMQSNLTLQVTFADVTKPTVGISAPTANQQLSNAVFTVKGTAGDNVRVSNVWHQLNGGSWAGVSSTNGWTNWTATVGLQAGTNVVRAYAVDTGGNKSLTNSVSFVTSNAFKLRLGFGSLQPLTSSGLELRLDVSPGVTCRIEISTNLVDWLPLTNFVGTNAPIPFRDSAATNYHWRFYRALVP